MATHAPGLLHTRGRAIGLFLLGIAAVHGAAAVISAQALVGTEATLAATAVVVDLTLTTALWFWFTLVRPGHARLRTALGVVALNVLLARLLLPADTLGDAFWLLAGAGALAELSLLGLTLARLRDVRAGWARARAAGEPGHRALALGLEAAMPAPVAQAAATEAALLGLALTGWFRRSPPVDARTRFSVHRESQWPTMVGVFLFLIAAEGIGLHLVLAPRWPWAATLHAGLAVYGALWLLGDVHALRLQPVVLAPDALRLAHGLRWSGAVPYARIAAVTPGVDLEPDDPALRLALPGTTVVLIETTHPIEMTGPFGIRRETDRIALGVDEAPAFVRALAARRGA